MLFLKIISEEDLINVIGKSSYDEYNVYEMIIADVFGREPAHYIFGGESNVISFLRTAAERGAVFETGKNTLSVVELAQAVSNGRVIDIFPTFDESPICINTF